MDGLYSTLDTRRTRTPRVAPNQYPQIPQAWQSWLQSQYQNSGANQKGFGKFLSGLNNFFPMFGGIFGANPPGTPGAGPAPAHNPSIPQSALDAVDTRLQANLLTLAGGGDPYAKQKKKKD
jgi:hypothetical protein